MVKFRSLSAGDTAPWFIQATASNPRYALDTAAGRYIVLCFFLRAAELYAEAALAAVFARPDLFDVRRAIFFGVTTDPEDVEHGRIAERPGYRFFHDFDLTASRAYGAVALKSKDARARWVVLDPTMRVIEVIEMLEDGSDVARVLALVGSLPSPDAFAGPKLQAPILFLPRVFEPEFCDQLVALYDAEGGALSGFTREVGGKTVGLHDARHKVRRDVYVADKALKTAVQVKIMRRVVPEIRKVHQFEVTRMERYLVACYDAAEGGHFNAHRDNTTPGTAHRRFAVSINLNDDFEGGEVSFPEYGPHGFKAPKGGAVVFSCSLLHAVSRVTSGRRYAFLPFLYDDAAAAIRARNAGDGGAQTTA